MVGQQKSPKQEALGRVMGKPDHSQRSGLNPAPHLVAANMKQRDAALLGQSEGESHPLISGLSWRFDGRVMGISRLRAREYPGFFIALLRAALKNSEPIKNPGARPGTEQTENLEQGVDLSRGGHRPGARLPGGE
ncbi:hypothetical protein SynMEDNS5_01882 [Synechococcus sp. MEDNS5]|nr:hypothetical protein SynMEDNS5_01882 [Synechococcus sp. MEDNS5]